MIKTHRTLIFSFISLSIVLQLFFFLTQAKAACVAPTNAACPIDTWGCYDNDLVLIQCCGTFAEQQTCQTSLPATAPVVDTTEVFCNSTPGNVRTSIGCINASEPKTFINQIVTWSVGIAAGAAFVTIAYAGFLMVTASGDPKRVNDAKSFMVSALLGLVIISIAILIFNFVGVRIFGTGSFGFSV